MPLKNMEGKLRFQRSASKASYFHICRTNFNQPIKYTYFIEIVKEYLDATKKSVRPTDQQVTIYRPHFWRQ